MHELWLASKWPNLTQRIRIRIRGIGGIGLGSGFVLVKKVGFWTGPDPGFLKGRIQIRFSLTVSSKSGESWRSDPNPVFLYGQIQVLFFSRENTAVSINKVVFETLPFWPLSEMMRRFTQKILEATYCFFITLKFLRLVSVALFYGHTVLVNPLLYGWFLPSSEGR